MRFGTKLLERFSAGQARLGEVQAALQQALGSGGDREHLRVELQDALERGLISRDVFRTLFNQLDQATLYRRADEQVEPQGTIVRPSSTSSTPPPAPSSHGTMLRARAGAQVTFERSGPELDAGTVIRGRYQLESRLGAGGMGQVWKARDLLLEQARDPRPHVAIKLLSSDFEQHPDAFVSLQREAAKAQDLAHPNIATVHTFDLDPETGLAFISMELLVGQTLDELIDENPNGLEPALALRIIRQLAAGLAHAHQRGIVHCDFKPGNAFVTTEGVAKILDFGIARIAKDSALRDDVFDAGSLGALTPAYATIELSRGDDPDPSDDVYALGLVAFELLTGTHPFGRRSADELKSERPALPNLAGLKRREVRAVHRAVALDRQDRWPDARAFVKAMEGHHPMLVPLAGIAAALALAALYSTYQYVLESRPQVPFAQLPLSSQTEFRAAMVLGDEAYAFATAADSPHEALQVILGDAISQYALAYTIHPKNRDASAALRKSIGQVSDTAKALGAEDREQVRLVLEKLRKDYTILSEYPPLIKAINALR